MRRRLREIAGGGVVSALILCNIPLWRIHTRVRREDFLVVSRTGPSDMANNPNNDAEGAAPRAALPKTPIAPTPTAPAELAPRPQDRQPAPPLAPMVSRSGPRMAERKPVVGDSPLRADAPRPSGDTLYRSNSKSGAPSGAPPHKPNTSVYINPGVVHAAGKPQMQSQGRTSMGPSTGGPRPGETHAAAAARESAERDALRASTLNAQSGHADTKPGGPAPSDQDVDGAGAGANAAKPDVTP